MTRTEKHAAVWTAFGGSLLFYGVILESRGMFWIGVSSLLFPAWVGVAKLRSVCGSRLTTFRAACLILGLLGLAFVGAGLNQYPELDAGDKEARGVLASLRAGFVQYNWPLRLTGFILLVIPALTGLYMLGKLAWHGLASAGPRVLASPGTPPILLAASVALFALSVAFAPWETVGPPYTRHSAPLFSPPAGRVRIQATQLLMEWTAIAVLSGSAWLALRHWGQAHTKKQASPAERDSAKSLAAQSHADRSDINDLHQKILAAEKLIAERDQKIRELEIAKAIAEAAAKEAAEPKYDPVVLRYAEKFATYMDKKAAQATVELRAMLSQMGAGIPDPTIVAKLAIIGAAKLTRGAVDFARWSKSMMDELGDMADKFKPYLDKAFEESKKVLHQELAQGQPTTGGPPPPVGSRSAPSGAQPASDCEP